MPPKSATGAVSGRRGGASGPPAFLPRAAYRKQTENEPLGQAGGYQKQERIQKQEIGFCARFTRTSCYG